MFNAVVAKLFKLTKEFRERVDLVVDNRLFGNREDRGIGFSRPFELFGRQTDVLNRAGLANLTQTALDRRQVGLDFVEVHHLILTRNLSIDTRSGLFGRFEERLQNDLEDVRSRNRGESCVSAERRAVHKASAKAFGLAVRPSGRRARKRVVRARLEAIERAGDNAAERHAAIGFLHGRVDNALIDFKSLLRTFGTHAKSLRERGGDYVLFANLGAGRRPESRIAHRGRKLGIAGLSFQESLRAIEAPSVGDSLSGDAQTVFAVSGAQGFNTGDATVLLQRRGRFSGILGIEIRLDFLRRELFRAKRGGNDVGFFLDGVDDVGNDFLDDFGRNVGVYVSNSLFDRVADDSFERRLVDRSDSFVDNRFLSGDLLFFVLDGLGGRQFLVLLVFGNSPFGEKFFLGAH